LRKQLALTFLLLTLLGSSPCLAAVDPAANQVAILDRIQKEVDEEKIANSSAQELEQIVENDPKNARAHLLMGECLQLLGLKDQALEQFKLGVSYGSDYPPAYVGLIKQYLRQGQIGPAKALIEDAKRRFPKNFEIDFWLGNFYQSREQFRDAMDQYSKALKSDKPIFGLGSAIAKLLLRDRRYYDAIVFANQDLKLRPNFPLANELKGLALFSVGRYKEALPPLAIAFNASAYNIDIANAYAQCLYWNGDYQTALPVALVNMAFSARLNGNDPRSKKLVTEIINSIANEQKISQLIVTAGMRYPINKAPAYHFALGDVLDRNGYNRLAMKQYQTGLALKNDFGRAWYRLGLDYESIDHNYQAALDCYKKAAVFSPGDKQIALQQSRLEDRLANRNDDLAWQLKDKMGLLAKPK
jgi:tetratricopeptide (TPR) repeat protein